METLTSEYFYGLRDHFQMQCVEVMYNDKKLTYGSPSAYAVPLIEEMGSDIRLAYYFHSPLNQKLRCEFQQLQAIARLAISNCIAHQQTIELARKDPVTGLDNRCSFDEHFLRMLKHSKRYLESPFGLLILDLDNFKTVNDTYGHQMGDRILTTFAQEIKNVVRDTDICFRFGGDEFCCLLPGSIPTVNEEISVRIHNAVRRNPLLQKYNVSCSIGSAYSRHNDTVDSLFKRADDALYQSKQIQGNSVNYA